MIKQECFSRAKVVSSYVKERGVANGLLSAVLVNAVTQQALPRCIWFLHEPNAPCDIPCKVLQNVKEGKL